MKLAEETIVLIIIGSIIVIGLIVIFLPKEFWLPAIIISPLPPIP